MIEIPYKKAIIKCSTVEEAKAILDHIAEAEEKANQNRDDEEEALVETGEKMHFLWTTEKFWRFLENLGESQQKVLKLLVSERRVKDKKLRQILRLPSNQSLAGVLSGISKQAGNQTIPARSVYTIENEFKSGKVTKTYVVAIDFCRMAHNMNWPED